MHNWSVVLPAKRLAVAKTRLRPLTAGLDDATGWHRELVLALLRDTVAAAAGCAVVTDLLVVTDDPAAAEVAAQVGARTVADGPDGGLNAAVEHGAGLAEGRSVAVLSSDLPALRPEELAAALLAAEAVPRAFVSDVHGTGTTLLTAVDTGLRAQFGPGSAQAHGGDGARALRGHWPGLAHDVDTAADLRTAADLGVGESTASVLERLRAVGAHL